MSAMWPTGRPVVDVRCTLDIEQTPESFHAYAVPEDIEIRPGDVVLVHGAPAHVPFGARIRRETRASVARAGLLRRVWTRFASLADLTELYEVGFEPKVHP